MATTLQQSVTQTTQEIARIEFGAREALRNRTLPAFMEANKEELVCLPCPLFLMYN
jgi:hypothetical protein